jgi:hypothetical protein
MADSKPGFSAIKETEEAQLWAAGPDNNHKRFHQKIDIKSTSTDSGNTPTTTLRAGLVMAKKDSDSMAYPYVGSANDGTQKVVGILEKHLSMLDRDGTAEDKFTRALVAGILKNATADLVGSDKHVLAVLARIGFTFAGTEPHGSQFLLHPKARYFKAADYTLVDADHGCMFVATTGAVNFTLPTLATVGKGYEVLLYNGVDASMVITAAANTIISGDAGGAVSTSITFSTANAKMGGAALMYADYDGPAGALAWYALLMGRTATFA